MRTRIAAIAILTVAVVVAMVPSAGWATGSGSGSNGTVKIAGAGDFDSIPSNQPHVGCDFTVEWYTFAKGSSIWSNVTFEMQAPTSDVDLTVTGRSWVFVGADSATGAGTSTGPDGRENYTLSFDGAPHPQQGYHVKMTVETPGSSGSDKKSKVFWVEDCVRPAPALMVTKSVADSNDADAIGSLGELLTYSFSVTNTGNVPLSAVTITDPMIPALASGATCVASLAAGATTACTSLPAATHTVTAADIAAGSVHNTATGTGTPPGGANVSDTAEATISTPAAPSIRMTKAVADSGDADSLASLGEVLTYSFTVTNTGNVPLTAVRVTDPMIPALASGADCVATLAVGATTACPLLPAATHAVSPADISAGSVPNTATSSARPPTGADVVARASATIASPATPALSLTKTVADSNDADSLASLGEVLTYSFSVTNTGNVPLTAVRVTDAVIPALASGATCVATLAVGATTTCPSLPAATHTTSAADLAHGSVDNTATGTGTPPSGANVSTQASATIATKPNVSAIVMTKTVADSGDADSIGSLGEVLTYSFTVTNTGNLPLGSVTITDAMIPALAAGAPCVATLAVGATTTCPSLPAATHTVSAADILRGSVDNTATSTGTPSTGADVTATASAGIATPATPSISLSKSVADSTDADTVGSLGEVLTYSFTVTNTGNVPLTAVRITDAMIPALASGATCVATLAVGATTTCPSLPAATHTVTTGDIAEGSVDNTATGSAKPPTGANATATGTATISTPASPGMILSKTVADSGDADSIGSLGEVLTYSFTVTNTGNVPLTAVRITDAMIPALASGAPCVAILPVGATTTCPQLPAATHTVSPADIDYGSVRNTATASGRPESGADVTAEATAIIATPAAAAVAMTKAVADSDDADSVAAEGEVLTYSFTVTNTGNVPLANVRLTDPMIPALASGAVCVDTLPAGATTTCPQLAPATHTTTAADVTHGSVANTASTIGTPPHGADVTAQAGATIATLGAPPVDPEEPTDPTDPTDPPDPTDPFNWDWQYQDPTCNDLTVDYPSDLPGDQANDVNVMFETNQGVFTLNFHKNDGFWSGTTSFPYATHPSWPAGVTSYSVVWTQVGGSNYHWQGGVPCLVDDDGDVTTVDVALAVTSIEGWRTSTVTVKKGAVVTSDVVTVDQVGDEDLVLQRLIAGTWSDVKTVAVDDTSARVSFGRQTRKGTFQYRLMVPGSDDVTGAATRRFTVRVR